MTSSPVRAQFCRSGVAIFDNRDNGGDDDRGTGRVKEKEGGSKGELELRAHARGL